MLLHVALFMQLGTVPLDPPSVELETRRRELGFLHSAIDRTALRTLSVWDPQTNVLREPRSAESVDDGSSPVLILHLWATWCVPCKEEFPLWGAMGQHLAARHKGKVRIVHVALQTDSSDMGDYVRQLQGKLPFPVKYFDHSERLVARLRQVLDSQPPLPLTLVLDSERVVRQAFLGSIHDRQQELVDATARLIRLHGEQPALARQTSPLPSDTQHCPATAASELMKPGEPKLPADTTRRSLRDELFGPQTSSERVESDLVKPKVSKLPQDVVKRARRDELVGPQGATGERLDERSQDSSTPPPNATIRH